MKKWYGQWKYMEGQKEWELGCDFTLGFQKISHRDSHNWVKAWPVMRSGPCWAQGEKVLEGTWDYIFPSKCSASPIHKSNILFLAFNTLFLSSF